MKADTFKSGLKIKTQSSRYFVGVTTLFLAYFFSAKLGLSFEMVSGFVTLVWPPTGIAIAALLFGGIGLWPGIALAAFLVNFQMGTPVAVAAGIAFGNTLEAVVAVHVLRRRDFDISFVRLQDVFNFVLFAAFLSTTLSATIGVLSFWIGGVITDSSLLASWTAWWMGDMLGALVVGPLLLVWSSFKFTSRSMNRKRMIETIAFTLFLIFISHTVINYTPSAVFKPYISFPFIIWIAIRFGARGTTAATFLIAVAGIWATALDTGPFAGQGMTAGFRNMNFFLSSLAGTGLTLTAAIAERARIYKESVTANRMKDEFLATLSHELRTPLNSIVGWADLLYNGEIVGDDIHEAVEIIHRNAHIQAQLINDLLDVSRIITGKLQIDPQEVDIENVVENAIAAVRLAGQAKNIKILKSTAKRIGKVQGDANRLQQVVWNLLANAIRFTPNDGSVTLQLKKVAMNVEISVTDTGEGIDPNFLPYVFDRFRQVDNSRSRRHGGLGLGLAIVRHIVDAHGGTVRASSSGHGRGSTFTVCLPLNCAVESTRLLAEEALTLEQQPIIKKLQSSQLEGMQILVVDDDEAGRKFVRKILSNHGAQVIEAASAKEAMKIMQDFEPNVIISDIGMPEMDGFEFMRTLRAMSAARIANVPSIALTAYAREEEKQEALNAGFLAHLAKPVQVGLLVESVVRLAGHI